MLTTLLAHGGRPPQPHDLWTAWNLDPLLIVMVALAAVVFTRGRRRGTGRRSEVWRARAYGAALLVLVIALISPLEALASALASAHMVQHLLLTLVAGPLLAFSAPTSTLLRGAPGWLRRSPGRMRSRLGGTSRLVRTPSHPAVVWLLHVAAVWFWHSAAAYQATLRSEPVHVLEHVTFLVTAVLFWRVILGGRRGARVAPGLALLLVFGMAMQSVLLSVLLTFSPEPWYAGYASTTTPWGLEPLADQQLAGALLWVPAGAVHVIVAIGVFVAWLRTGAAAGAGVR